MVKLLNWMKQKQKDDIEEKEISGEIRSLDELTRERYMNFRSILTKDEEFCTSKQRILGPVYDFKTKDKVNPKSKASWVSKMINRESTRKHSGDHSERANKVPGGDNSGRTSAYDSPEEVDEDYNFFNGAAYFEHRRSVRNQEKKAAKKKAKQSLHMQASAVSSQSAQNYMAHRPA